MGLNQILMKFFKLPPAVMMLLAVAGFGGLAPLLFFLLPSLRDRNARLWIIAVLIGVAVIAGIIYLITRLVRRKKSAQLTGALESQGPTRGDIAEQEQIYREKFRGKLNDLKTNGLSVYHLPWFVLMGEPGCGKTATLIHSGLDFPLGKDEVPGFGGTRNYNWWFTNEAVILDTAGRIAFHEEGTTDKVEWEYFCKLLRQYRPRCPVNGIVVAIPADKLLRDSAEEREQKATILRERLRQVQQVLGIRFPTYVIVTKMDLIGGFSEFFEEIRVDLQQRNQMFGWSRPDEFQTPYDPSSFPGAFDAIYRRIRDWAMRYLQRKATEQELGMVATFPESFRQIRQPLYDYIATIFQKSPLLEPPFFRGFYFTSAMQEGAPIFDVFAKSRTGTHIEARPTRAVDSKAFFIHDFYEKKVFPENGLVFRSAKHVTLNKRMRRMVWYGSAGLAAALLAIVGVGLFNFKELVTNPRSDCAAAAQTIQLVASGKPDARPKFTQLNEHVRLAGRLHEHMQRFTGFWNHVTAHALFIFASPKEPEQHVRAIHARYVLDTILAPTVAEFASRILTNPRQFASGSSPDDRKRYIAGLARFAQWYGEVVGQKGAVPMSRENAATRAGEFDEMLVALGVGEAERKAAAGQVQAALESLSGDRVFALDILRRHCPETRDPAALTAAIAEITERWKPFARIDGANTDDHIRFWVDFLEAIRGVRAAYGRVVGLASDFADRAKFPEASAQLLAQTEGVEALPGEGPPPNQDTFVASVYSLRNFLERNKERIPAERKRILRLADIFSRFKRLWDIEFAAIERGLAVGAPPDQPAGAAVVYDALAKGRKALDETFADSMKSLRAALGIEADLDPLKHLVDQNILAVTEAPPDDPGTFPGTPTIVISSGAFGRDRWLIGALTELRSLAGQTATAAALDDLTAWPKLIADMKAGDPAELNLKALGAWFKAVPPDRTGAALATQIVAASGIDTQSFWRPVELYDTSLAAFKGRRNLRFTETLNQMVERCRKATAAPELPGLARLRPGLFDQADRDLPFDRHVYNDRDVAPAQPAAVEKPAQAEPQDTGRRRRRREAEDEPTAPAAQDERTDRRLRTEPLLQRYHNRDFLVENLRLYVEIGEALKTIPEAAGLGTELNAAAAKYVDTYFADWAAVYDDYRKLLDPATLAFIERCRDAKLDWPQFVDELKRDGPQILGSLTNRQTALVKHVLLFDDGLKENTKPDDAIFDFINTRLDELQRAGRSLVDRLEGVRKLKYPRQEGPLDDYLANRLDSAWVDYLNRVESLGRLDGAPPPQARIPDADALRTTLTIPATPDFHVTAPLTDLAGYGRDLLTAHLERKIATIFKDVAGYPVIADNAVRDSSPAFDALARVATLDPARFTELLLQVAQFKRDYKDVYLNRAVVASPRADRTLEICADWSRFLFSSDDPKPGAAPQPIPLQLVFNQDRSKLSPAGWTNLGSFYDSVALSLPILDSTTDQVAGEIKVPVRRGTADHTYRWLLTSEKKFNTAIARVTELSDEGRARGLPDPAVAWQLPASPWSLLLPLEARRETAGDPRSGLIPIVIVPPAAAGSERLGNFVVVTFERPLPRPIPPLPAPEPIKGMDARKYLPKPGEGPG